MITNYMYQVSDVLYTVLASFLHFRINPLSLMEIAVVVSKEMEGVFLLIIDHHKVTATSILTPLTNFSLFDNLSTQAVRLYINLILKIYLMAILYTKFSDIEEIINARTGFSSS